MARWAQGAGLRIPYLHVFLLGFVILGLVEAARRAYIPGRSDIPTWPLYLGVAVLLVTLLPVTSLWPDALLPDSRLLIVALGTVTLTAAALVFWFQLRRGAICS